MIPDNLKRYIDQYRTRIPTDDELTLLFDKVNTANLSSEDQEEACSYIEYVLEEAKVNLAVKSYNGHEYVDLGLPSGTLWATCNIGASKPEEYGNYFAWGETEGYDEGKREFSEDNYKFYTRKRGLFGSKLKLTKYCFNSKNGDVDKDDVLSRDDNAAYVQWGKGWRTPTARNFWELLDKRYTETDWTSLNGVNGLKVKSRENEKNIFFPAAGSYEGRVNEDAGIYGCYWTRWLCSKDKLPHMSSDDYYDIHAMMLWFSDDDISDELVGQRWYGYTIRPVRFEEKS